MNSRLVMAAGLAATMLAAPILAADDARRCCTRLASGLLQPTFDEASGRWPLLYAPDRSADWLHMKLELTIPDMNTPRLLGRQTLTYAPFTTPVEEVRLDAVGLAIEGVRINGAPANYTYDGETLRVRVQPPTAPGSQGAVQIDYTATDPRPCMVWIPESPDRPGQPAQLHTLGETNWNRFWFPCHDHPNDRITSELIVAVPDGFEVISNGRLTNREPGWLVDGTRRKMDIFTWTQDPGHPAYLVSLVVGKFRTEDVGNRRLSMPVHVPIGRDGDIRATYGRTMQMLRVFEDRFDEPYPWARYAQALVWNFAAGGMEHTAATTMYDYAVYLDPQAEDSDLEDLIAHELAHQWFGDLITCRTWEHLWLNEGFATFSEALWYEELGGDEAYLAYTTTWLDELDGSDNAQAPEQPAMATKQVEHGDDMFGLASNPYPKGALVLHALREMLGDDLFFRAIAEYVNRHRLSEVETDDFRRVVEEVSGESLERFFAQWVYRPGLANIDIRSTWQGDGRLRIDLEQTQNIDGDNPAFALDVPLYLSGAGATSGRWLTIPMSEKSASVTVALDAEPAFIAADPRLTAPSVYTVQQSTDAWLTQLREGPTVVARIRAARALGEAIATGDTRTGEVVAALEAVAASKAHRRLRLACVEAIASGEGNATSIDSLLRLGISGIDDAWVRAAVVGGLSSVVGTDASLKERAGSAVLAAAADRSSRVRAAAIRAIADLGMIERFDLIRTAGETESQDDRLRRAAIAAAEALDSREGLELILSLTSMKHLEFTRAMAIGAAARRMHHAPDRVRSLLVQWSQERDDATSGAAIDAIGEQGVGEAAPTLRQMRDRTRDPLRRKQLEAALKAIESGT